MGRSLGMLVTALSFVAVQQPSSTITGVVRDATGRPLVGASVQATINGGATQTVKTNADGTYEFPTMAAGQYEVRVQFDGFRVNRTAVVLDGRSRVPRDVIMALGSITQELTVTGQPGVTVTSGRGATGVPYNPPFKPPVPPDVGGRAGAPYTSRPCTPGPIGGDIREPRKVMDTKPIYPADVLAAGISGTVIVTGTVEKDGTVANLRVLRDAHPELSKAAAEAISKWMFTPTLLNCEPMAIEITATVNFTIAK